MSQIPMTKEYAGVVGPWGEKVESRSLLLEKLAFPKIWGDSIKENQASSWSLMRVASNGSTLLKNAKKDFERRSSGSRVEPQNAANMRAAAEVCGKLANIAIGSGLDPLRPVHSARFIELLRESHSERRLRIVEGRLEGRLAINLAEGVIQNAGISLDRIFGLPLIPGSAIKGVTRSVAVAELSNKRDAKTFETFARVFGLGKSEFEKARKAGQADGELYSFVAMLEQTGLPRDEKGNVCRELKGAVSFLQSTPTNDAKIVVDITNVHTPEYYRNGILADLKKEKPLPNYFPAVERGTEFSFPLLLNSMSNDVALLEAAERWLKIALEQHGIGAKTAAGYGWFSDITTEKKAQTEAEFAKRRQAEEQKAAVQSMRANPEIVARLTKLDEGSLRGMINRFVAVPSVWTTPEDEQRALLEVPKVLDLWSKEKENQKSKVTRGLAALAEKFGVKLP